MMDDAAVDNHGLSTLLTTQQPLAQYVPFTFLTVFSVCFVFVCLLTVVVCPCIYFILFFVYVF